MSSQPEQGSTPANDPVQVKNDDITNKDLEDPFPWYMVSVGVYIFDIVTDTQLAYRYFFEDELKYFGLTLIFTLLPNLIISYFCLKWYIADSKYLTDDSWLIWTVRCTMLFLLLGPVARYIDRVYYGMKCKREKDKKDKIKCNRMILYQDENDGLLCLFQAFMEAAPQLLLQLYILSHPLTVEKLFTVNSRKLSCASSFISIFWALTSQQHTMRIAQRDSKSFSWPAIIAQYIWVISVTGSRILTLGLYVSIFPKVLFTVCATRWILWICWLKSQQTKVFQDSFDEILHKCVLSVVYVFVFVNPSQVKTRWCYIFYYTYTLAENSVLIALWYIWVDPLPWYRDLAITSVFVFFFIGIVFKFVYYGIFHQTVSPKFWYKQGDTSVKSEFPQEVSADSAQCQSYTVRDETDHAVADNTYQNKNLTLIGETESYV